MNLAGIVHAHPERAVALITSRGDQITYGDLVRGAGGLRARLIAAGVEPGDRVGIVSVNDPAFVVAYLAVLGNGAVGVPLNPGSPPAELQRELSRVGVSAIVTGPGGVESVAAVESAIGVPVLSATHWADADGTGAPELVERQPEDLAVLMFSAGTAGAPRPAMLTHGNLLANLDQVQRHPGRAIDADECVLGVLPLFHIFGLNVVLGGALYVGARVLLLERVAPPTVLELIDRHGVTLLAGAPTMFAALAAVPDPTDSAGSPHRQPLRSVRMAFCGAAPLSSEVAEAWERRFGLPLRQGYGLTEASPVVTTAVMDASGHSASIGVPIPDVEVRLVDEDGEDALAADPGEIWVRGANVFVGYWDDEEATAAALTEDGWLRTGDVAVAGDDGQLYIVDRAKDLIIVSGFNVYPAEVEDALVEHPAVNDAAVVGHHDPYRGETVHAYVVLESGADRDVAADDLISWCAERLAGYKCPSEITFMPSLPHGLGGKLLRRALVSGQGATAPGAEGPGW